MGGKNNFIVATKLFHLSKISLVLREQIKVKILPLLDKNFIMKTYILLNFTLAIVKEQDV